jgi:hypothetical protein
MVTATHVDHKIMRNTSHFKKVENCRPMPLPPQPAKTQLYSLSPLFDIDPPAEAALPEHLGHEQPVHSAEVPPGPSAPSVPDDPVPNIPVPDSAPKTLTETVPVTELTEAPSSTDFQNPIATSTQLERHEERDKVRRGVMPPINSMIPHTSLYLRRDIRLSNSRYDLRK